jgi:hypothetical protein
MARRTTKRNLRLLLFGLPLVATLLGNGILFGIWDRVIAGREADREHLQMVADIRADIANRLTQSLGLATQLHTLSICKRETAGYDVDRRVIEIHERARRRGRPNAD